MSNKTSDKNVANIERLNNFANMTFLYGHRVNLNVSGLKGVQQDIKNVLVELEQKDKRIKELEEEKVELKEYNKIVSDRIVEYKKNSIPKQAVIDKIKEYDKKMEEDAGHPNWVVTDRIVMNVLQELLEGERK